MSSIFNSINKLFTKLKRTLSVVITNPFVISLVISSIIVLTLPDLFDKYTIEIVQQNKLPSNLTNYYADLNNDGVSEKIEFRQMQSDFFSLTVFKNNKIIDQWNFKGRVIRTDEAIINESRNVRFKYLYFFVFDDNKIYINCLNPLNRNFITKNKFVDDFVPKNKELDLAIHLCGFYDENNDGINEFFFSTEVSYSIEPRRVFKYDPAIDKIYESPPSYAGFSGPGLIDTTDNDFNLLFASDAVGNTDVTVPYSDMFAWLMDFNKDLTFKSKPIKIGLYPSNSRITLINLRGKKYIICLNVYTGIENYKCTLRLYDLNNNLIRTKNFPYTPEWNFAFLYRDSEDFQYFWIVHPNGKIEKMNVNLETIKEIFIPPVSTVTFLPKDIDGDNKNEFIFMSANLDQIYFV